MSGRGRGRGGRGRGRGRGGGRGGRGRAGGRGRRVAERPEWEIGAEDRAGFAPAAAGAGGGGAAPPAKPDITADPVGFFMTSTITVDDHIDAQENHRVRYISTMVALEEHGIDMSPNARVRSLAAAWARADTKLAEALLSWTAHYGLVEVLKAVTVLDAGRRIREMEKKLKKIELSGTKMHPQKMGKFKSDMDNLKALQPKRGSANGVICKQVQRWVRTLSKDQLEFFALHMPKEPWTRLADICHFNPQKDFAVLPWFLAYCFGTPAPEQTMVNQCKDLSVANVNDLIKEYDIPYSHLRTMKESLTPVSKERIAGYTTLDQILWYYEELQCPEVDKVVNERLDAGDTITLTTGKLMERLLTLKMIREDISLCNVEYEWIEETEELKRRVRKADPNKASFFPKLLPLAQKRLEEIKLPLESPIAVLGDMSGSMDVAIRTSTIIAAILTAITNAKLSFFNTQSKDAEVIPHNMKEVLEMAVSIEADAATSPAAGLYPYFERGEVIKTFVLVTDEQENEDYKGYNFCELFKKYHASVFPASLVFVSFLEDQHAPGQMVTQLREAGFKPLQFKFHGAKPDLTKLDKLFGIMSSRSGNFDEELAKLEEKAREITASANDKNPADLKAFFGS